MNTNGMPYSPLPPVDGLATPSSTSNKDIARIASTARQFESILLGQWLQGAESSFGAVPGEAEDQDAGGDQMKSFALQQLATSLANHGGIGISGLVSKALQKSSSTQKA